MQGDKNLYWHVIHNRGRGGKGVSVDIWFPWNVTFSAQPFYSLVYFLLKILSTSSTFSFSGLGSTVNVYSRKRKGLGTSSCHFRTGLWLSLGKSSWICRQDMCSSGSLYSTLRSAFLGLPESMKLLHLRKHANQFRDVLLRVRRLVSQSFRGVESSYFSFFGYSLHVFWEHTSQEPVAYTANSPEM